MSNSIFIDTALCLSAPDIEALIEGRMIVAMPRTFITPGRQFALYPAAFLMDVLPIERYYKSSFLPIAQTALTQVEAGTVTIKAWAKCEDWEDLDNSASLDILSRSTIWTSEGLQQKFAERRRIFLKYLRVYRLPQPIEVPVNPDIEGKIGKFMGVPYLTVAETMPVLSDAIFARRRHQLENRLPPLHPELEELQGAIAPLALTNPAARELDRDLKILLGWSSDKAVKQLAAEEAWIKDIAVLADRSIEVEEKKSNYQAGTDFENIARRGLEFLGFKVEEAYKGGAGGLDLFCSKPYPLAGECKAGKSIPDRSVEELDRIGKRHLQENYLSAVRVIIGPGQPTKNLQDSAKISKISIVKAMTLQKLVELQAKYPNSVNLIELKEYLQPGQIDGKIDEYIEKILKRLRLRSRVVQIVKEFLQKAPTEKSVGFGQLHGIYVYSNPPQPLLSREQLHEILIELSSPLTGYLGREEGSEWESDRFYFLRDLNVESE